MSEKNISKEKKAPQIPTPHIGAKKSEIARTVIMPGNPLRAQWAAETFLKKTELVSNIRGICAYTGTYEGKPVTILASGMGAPSAGIYAYELFNFYGVEKIIRTGTCGGMQKNIKSGDIVIALSASTDSNYASQYRLDGTFAPCADFELLKKADEFAQKNKITAHTGMVFSSDFLSSYNQAQTWKDWAKMGALGHEMETYALYCNAFLAKKKALSILTSTINLHTHQGIPENPQTVTPMMRMALSLV